ncbi:MAG: hypothetical protein ACXWPS_17995 [Ktedonobacteraceae bacterium]
MGDGKVFPEGSNKGFKEFYTSNDTLWLVDRILERDIKLQEDRGFEV